MLPISGRKGITRNIPHLSSPLVFLELDLFTCEEGFRGDVVLLFIMRLAICTLAYIPQHLSLTPSASLLRLPWVGSRRHCPSPSSAGLGQACCCACILHCIRVRVRGRSRDHVPLSFSSYPSCLQSSSPVHCHLSRCRCRSRRTRSCRLRTRTLLQRGERGIYNRLFSPSAFA